MLRLIVATWLVVVAPWGYTAHVWAEEMPVSASHDDAPAKPLPPVTFEFAWWNDFFAATLDDDGFTADVEVLAGLHIDRGALRTLSLGLRNRWLTESHGGKRRWDLLELTTASRFDVAKLGLRITPRLGLALAGNLGGARLQDLGHRILRAGRTLAEGSLQDTYPEGRKLGAIAGMNLQTPRALSSQLTIAPILDAQFATGTGVRWFSAALGLRYASGRFRTAGECSLTWYGSSDPQLHLPGGYANSGPELGVRATFAYQMPWLALGYELRLNEGGSGERTAIVFYRLGRGEALRTHR